MHPLDIPEILSHIASFLPVIEGPQDAPTFVPRDLLSCTLVCRSWSEAMLPYLWAVYTPKGMETIPTDTLSRNSIYFRHIDQGKVEQHLDVAHQLYQEDASGCPLLQCTALKSFSLTSKSLPKQLDLLRSNRDLTSLEWWFFQRNSLPGTIREAVEPFAASLKELHLHYGVYNQRDLTVLLNSFPNLEHFHIDVRIAPLIKNNNAAAATTIETESNSSGPSTNVSDDVRIPTLKRLSFREKLLHQSSIPWCLALFNHCPIEHVSVEAENGVRPNIMRN